jgi:hypothetical protein
MNKFSVIISGIVIVVATMLFVSFFPRCCSSIGSQKTLAEGFEDSKCLKPELFNTCPLNSKSFQDEGGATLCCKGDVHGHTCDGEILCSFAPNKKGIQHCVPYVRNLLERIEMDACPSRIPKVFMDTSITEPSGCVKGPISSTFDEPVNKSDKTCSFKDTSQKGCAAMRAYEDAVCPRRPCVFNEVEESHVGSYLVANYKNKNNKPINCIDDKSFFEGVFTSNYKGPLGPPENFCSVQKKVVKGMSLEQAIKEFVDPRNINEDPASALRQLAESQGGVNNINNSQLQQVCFNIPRR